MNQRSLSLEIWPPADKKQAVLDGIRRYRMACRKVFSVLGLAQTAGATVTDDGTLKPSSDSGKLVAACAIDATVPEVVNGEKGEGNRYTLKIGKGFAYEMRTWFLQELFPTALSFVWDSARRDCTTAWTSRDPEFPTASRGWLAMQGTRGFAQFRRRGIGFPPATARPKLAGHTLALKWDRELGEIIFDLGKLDGGRYVTWKRLRDGLDGYELGTIYLGECDGKIRATITYSFPATAADLDPEAICAATFGEPGESWLTIRCGIAVVTVSSEEATAWLTGLRDRRAAIEMRRRACGSPNKPWGDRPGWKAAQAVVDRVTARRLNGAKHRNHCWARRIVEMAKTNRCGKIRVASFPETLAGHPWQWAELKSFIGYRAELIGADVVFA